MKCIAIPCIVILLCCLQINLAAKDIRIALQVSNKVSNEVFIQQAHLDQSQLAKTHRIDLSTSGSAEFVYPISNATFIELLYNGYAITLFLGDNSSPTISFDAQNIAQTLRFSGPGSIDNNFIADFDRVGGGAAKASIECAYLDIAFSAGMIQSGQTMATHDYIRVLNNRYAEQKKLLSERQSSLSREVYDFYAAQSLYEKESDKLFWILHRWNSLDASGVRSAMTQLNMGTAINWNDGAAIAHPAYKNALKAQAIWHYLPNDPFQQRAYTKVYSEIEQHFSGETACFMTTHLLVKVYEKSGDSDLGRSKISQLQKTCSQYTEAVMQMYGGDISGVEDIAAEDIDMVDKAGGLVSLEEYQGKVVYISFWASWCKPCIAGFEKSKSIRKQLQDMGVVLVNISIDKKEEAWRDAMIRHNPLGINTWAISLQNLAQDYDISSIPLYHIINKQGKFAYLSDTGSRDIVEEFRTLVAQ